MRRTHSVSRRAAVWLIVSALGCGATEFVSHRFRPLRSDNKTTTLAAECEQLRIYDDATRDALRTQRTKRAQAGWTAQRLRNFGVPPGWLCQWEPSNTPTRRALLTLIAPRLNDWPACLAYMRECASQPGVALDSVEVVAAGATRQRRFTRIAFALRFTLVDATNLNGERTFPSRLPAIPTNAEITAQKVGLGPSLRLSSAAAELSAAGPASASARLGPPTDRAASENNIPL